MKTYSTKLIVSVVAFIAVIGGIFGLVSRQSSSQSASNPVTPPVDTPVATVPTTTTSSGKYKDGTYTATASYRSPGGSDDLTVSLTLKDGIVTDATVTPGAHDRESSEYQSRFINGYKAVVIGKSIDTLIVGKVSGSSLTPIGFNAAVAKIKTQAQA